MSDNYIVYVLLCSDNSFYCGITNNLEKRLNKHRTGNGSKYVASRGPFALRATWFAGSRSEALKEEAKFKSLSRKQKIKVINEKNPSTA